MANPRLKSPWYNKDYLRELGKIIQEGDLIEFRRTTYRHWAVCVEATGDIRIVHHVSDLTVGQYVFASKKSSNMAGHAGITMEAMEDVLGNDKVRINNSKDDKFPRRPQRDIVKSAKDAVGSNVLGEYDVVKNNCEHFARWCRYGKKESEQVADAISVAVFGAPALVHVAMKYLE